MIIFNSFSLKYGWQSKQCWNYSFLYKIVACFVNGNYFSLLKRPSIKTEVKALGFTVTHTKIFVCVPHKIQYNSKYVLDEETGTLTIFDAKIEDTAKYDCEL